MRELDVFLANYLTQGAFHAANFAAVFVVGPVGLALEVFSALGFVNHGFVKVCDCSGLPDQPK
jgi:hypothetical protein